MCGFINFNSLIITGIRQCIQIFLNHFSTGCSYKGSITLGAHPHLSAVKPRASSVSRIRKWGASVTYT